MNKNVESWYNFDLYTLVSGKKDPRRASNRQIQGEDGFREYQFISSHEIIDLTIMVCGRKITTSETI